MYASEVGLIPGFQINGQWKHLNELVLGTGIKSRDLKTAIGYAKNHGYEELSDLQKLSSRGSSIFAKIRGDVMLLKKAMELHEKFLKSENSIDVDDCVLKAMKLLEGPQGDEIASEFEHVLIDEFQDTNNILFRMLQALAEKTNFFVVGDPYQSIYRFRAANCRNMIKLEESYPDLKVIRLDRNYRSSGNIVTFSRQLMHHQSSLPKRNLYTTNIAGPKVLLKNMDDEMDQAGFIAAEIKSLIERSENELDTPLDFSDFAILYRMHIDADVLKRVFEQEGIPVSTRSDSVSTKESSQVPDGNRVLLSTVHSSKGTEFAFVYIINGTSDRFPHHFSVRGEDLEEERRVFFVGATRAGIRLTISKCVTDTWSPFITTLFSEPNDFLAADEEIDWDQVRCLRGEGTSTECDDTPSTPTKQSSTHPEKAPSTPIKQSKRKDIQVLTPPPSSRKKHKK